MQIIQEFTKSYQYQTEKMTNNKNGYICIQMCVCVRERLHDEKMREVRERERARDIERTRRHSTIVAFFCRLVL